MHRIRNSLSYANVMATVAVFVALGGGAYAAATLPKNSVGTKQLKNNAVVASKVKNGSLTARDFRSGQLPRGAQGPPGLTGQKGDTGPAGPTASASDSSGASFSVPLTNTVTPTAPVQAQITTTFQSRLVANGTAAVKDTASEAAPGDVQCVLSLDAPPPSVATGTTHLSQQARTRLPVSSTSAHSTIALTGRSSSLPPGTYFVGLHCVSLGSAATIDAADVTVTAVAG